MKNKSDPFETLTAEKTADWKAFIESRIISPNISPTIAQSWIRSNAAGVDPYSFHVHFLNEEELDALRQKNHTLLQYAKPLMHKLAEIGKEQIHVLSLHDADGYMLEICNENNKSNHWRDPFFRPGVQWRENDVGTNGVGRALIEKNPVEVSAQEHYNYNHHNLSCCAAPIKDSSGRLIAVLNLAALAENYSEHFRILVTLSSYILSNQLKYHENYELDAALFQSSPENSLVVDSFQIIIRCNEAAAKMFHVSAEALIGHHLQEIINVPELTRVLKECPHQPAVFRKCSSYYNGSFLLCDITATPLNQDGNRGCTLLTVENCDEIAKKTAAAAGQQALFTFDDLCTADSALLDAIEQAKNDADNDAPVVICGEKGTGKEIFAHALHACSSRSAGPFVFYDCASLPTETQLFDLFGVDNGPEEHISEHIGKVELADGGTLFLNNVEHLSCQAQLLLRSLLTTGLFHRGNGKADYPIDVRIIAAGDAELPDLLGKHCFSRELYNLLAQKIYNIPPLRARAGDIPIIANKKLADLNQSSQQNRYFSPDSIEFLRKQSWPGNDQQLRNAVDHAYADAETQITPSHFKLHLLQSTELLASDAADTGNFNSIELAERKALIELLQNCDNDVAKAAAELNISRATLYRRMKKFNIRLSDMN